MLGAIQALIERPRLDGYTEQQIARALRRGPWCWPTEATGAGRARELAPDGPPRLRPGQTLLVTADAGFADLWALDVGLGAAPTDGDALRFGSEARATWDVAIAALPRALPVLWSSVGRYQDAWLRALHLVLRRTTPHAAAAPSRAARERLLDGPSFGLSFLLALASLVLDDAVPADLAATGAVHPSGRIEAVGGLEGKIEVLAREAPGIRRLLVAASQEDAARTQAAAIAARFQVIGVATAAAAIEATLGPVPIERLVAAGSDGERRHDLSDTFFRLVLLGRREIVDWSPVARATALALERWPELADLDRRRLEFAHAVALRHDDNGGRLPALDASWLAAQPAPLRVLIVANYVQQSADTGEPDPALVIRAAESQLVRGREAFPTHLELLGALGRLLAVSGDARRALEYQAEAARGFLERMDRESVSFPLTEWYRLAGALDDHAAFDAAEAVRQTVEALGGIGPGQPYVELGRAKAQTALTTGDHSDAAIVLARLGAAEHIPAHIRWSAVRWHGRLLDESGGDTAPQLAELDSAGTRDPAQARRARPFRLLIELDRAVRQEDAARGAAALAELERLEPGIVGHLRRTAPPGRAPEWVARFFPY